MKLLCNDEEMSRNDPNVVPIKWRDDIYRDRKRKLKIGYILS